MGIDIPGVQLLCCAKSIGVDFSETMMVGRQRVIIPSDVIASIMHSIGVRREQTTPIVEDQFAEPLFALLGARQVLSIDVSDYEAPSQIHDFNQPLPKSLMNKFSVVFDGGAIEHVFNIPQAFKNCMEMVCVGGHFIQVNVANNYTGHGFWQFSPELIYRVFSRQNGFDVRVVFLHEPRAIRPRGAGFGSWYKVDDPAVHHCRVELVNRLPTYICTIARRVTDQKIFANFPQQSDYVETWELANKSQAVPVRSIRTMLPRPMRKLARWAVDAADRARGPFSRPYYHRISDDAVVCGRI